MSLENIDIQDLANFPDYEHEPRIAVPDGLVTAPGLVFKWYNMTKKISQNAGMLRQDIEHAKDFLGGLVVKGRILPLSGLGFVILSEQGNFLNTAIWDKKTPYILKNTIYDGEKRLGLDNGAFCAWELGIVAHEAKAWKKYLVTGKTEQDKREYLENTIQGEL
jgi:hypothetical protein